MNWGTRTRRGEQAPNARFTMQQVREFRRRFAEEGVPIARLAAEAGCPYCTMRLLIRGDRYPEPGGEVSG